MSGSSAVRQRASTTSQHSSQEDNSFLSSFKRLDAYAKPLEDFRVRTATGATVTLVSMLIVLLLVSSEFLDWKTVSMQPSIVVDVSRRDKMQINLNITFPNLPCYLLTIDVMDVSGDHQNDVDHSIFKVRVDHTGRPVETIKSEIGKKQMKAPDNITDDNPGTENCGSCYGGKVPPSGCCQTCEEVRKSYEEMNWSLSDYTNIAQV